MQLNATLGETARRFDVAVRDGSHFEPAISVNAFDHSRHPIITCDNPGQLSTDYRWGLVPPDWKNEPEAIWNHTISAKLEYLKKRYSWRHVQMNRCLVPITAFYEYHWNDAGGKSKTRFTVRNAQNRIVALGGLYSRWTFRGAQLWTFAVCTTAANDIMQFIHNKDAAKNYSRMPVMLNPGDEFHWLDPKIPPMDFAFPGYEANLVAEPDPEASIQATLF